jgi:hypothetical protein
LAAQRRRANIPLRAGNPVQPSEPLMKKLLSTLFVTMFAVAHGPLFAQEKKAEPMKEEAKSEAKKEMKTTEAKKTEAKKEETKKKEKKGGC